MQLIFLSNIKTKSLEFFEIQSGNDYWIKTTLGIIFHLEMFPISVWQSRMWAGEEWERWENKTPKTCLGLLRKLPWYSYLLERKRQEILNVNLLFGLSVNSAQTNFHLLILQFHLTGMLITKVFIFRSILTLKWMEILAMSKWSFLHVNFGKLLGGSYIIYYLIYM